MRDHNYVDEGGAIAAREEAQDVFVKWRGGGHRVWGCLCSFSFMIEYIDSVYGDGGGSLGAFWTSFFPRVG